MRTPQIKIRKILWSPPGLLRGPLRLWRWSCNDPHCRQTYHFDSFGYSPRWANTLMEAHRHISRHHTLGDAHPSRKHLTS